MNLSILYRGPLSSCNYACDYCPFAKRTRDGRRAGRATARALDRFVAWVGGRTADDRIGVLFTPWGEALVRRWYQDALAALTHLPHVAQGRDPDEPLVQARLGRRRATSDGSPCGARSTRRRSTRERFLAKCRELDRARRAVQRRRGRAEGAPRRDRGAAPRAAAARLPLGQRLQARARTTTRRTMLRGLRRRSTRCSRSTTSATRAAASRAGPGASVDLGGRRRHGPPLPLRPGADRQHLRRRTSRRACASGRAPNATCGCHIGYVHLDDLGLYDVFGDGVLERIPGADLSPVGRPSDAARPAESGYVSTSGRYWSGSSNPAVQATAWRQVVMVGRHAEQITAARSRGRGP